MTTLYLMPGQSLTDADQEVLAELKESEWQFARLTINYDDGWLRFDPGARLGKELFKLIARKVMTWKRGEQKFAGPWSPEREDFFSEYFGVEMEADDTDLLELACKRAEFYQDWSNNAHKRSAAAYARVDSIMRHIPMGQPILIGHHSEKHHRRDLERADSSMHVSVEERARGNKWAGKAQATIAHTAARYGKVKLSRRIRNIEKDMRLMEHRLETVLENGSDSTRVERWLAFYNGCLEVAYQLYQEVGGNMSDTENPNGVVMEPGGAVFALGSWFPIVRVNKKTVTVDYWLGIEGFTYLLTKDEVKKSMSPADWKAVQARVYLYGGGLKISSDATGGEK